MLYRLISQLSKRAFDCELVSLKDGGRLAERISACDVPIRSFGTDRPLAALAALPRLATWIRHRAPQLVQTWMYRADLVGGLAARLAGTPVVWGIRQSNLDPQASRRMTIWIARACARLSRWVPVRIVCCSEAARQVHVALGYSAEKMVVIPNGFDLDGFRPSEAARLEVRGELEISPTTPLVGLVGRFDPQKDHEGFLRAAAALTASRADVHYLLCGDGITRENPLLARWIDAAGLGDRCHLLGPRDDMARLNAALDVACSSSAFGEGFSNVVGEAMACGVPCAVTDVGDSARIVGDTGRVVPPRNPSALAAAMQELIDLETEGRRCLGLAARKRIEERFSLSSVVETYEALYRELSPHVRP